MKKYIAICEKSSIMENLAEALPEKLVKRGRNYYGRTLSDSCSKWTHF